MRYQSDGHLIIQGDCLAVLREMDDSSIDLVFADPPYNIGKKFGDFDDIWPSDDLYIEWSRRWLDECIRVLKPAGSMYVMASTQAMPLIDVYLRDKIEIISRIVWNYDSSGVQAKKYFGSMYEPIVLCVKDKSNYTFNADDVLVEARTGSVRKLIDYRGGTPKPYSTKKVPGNVWQIPRVRYRMGEYEKHPTQKPEALLERIIRASTNAGDVVLDPFSGTFSTAAVAKRLGRQSIGIERHLEFVKIGLRRVLGYSVFEGQSLEPLQKNTARLNKNGVKANKDLVDLDLFDGAK